MKKVSAATTIALASDFMKELDATIAAFRSKAESQFVHNITNNVPKKIMKLDDVISSALEHGFIGAATKRNQ